MGATIPRLDLVIKSFRWTSNQQDFENRYGKILGIGNSIIPPSQDILGDFGRGIVQLSNDIIKGYVVVQVNWLRYY